jgi:hypothetical protein
MNQNNVFRFYISMQDLILMHLTNSIKHIPNNKGSSLLRKSLPPWNQIKQLPTATKLQDNIKILLIAEETIDTNDTGMTQKALNLQLSNKLTNKIIAYNSLFLYDL